MVTVRSNRSGKDSGVPVRSVSYSARFIQLHHAAKLSLTWAEDRATCENRPERRPRGCTPKQTGSVLLPVCRQFREQHQCDKSPDALSPDQKTPNGNRNNSKEERWPLWLRPKAALRLGLRLRLRLRLRGRRITTDPPTIDP